MKLPSIIAHPIPSPLKNIPSFTRLNLPYTIVFTMCMAAAAVASLAIYATGAMSRVRNTAELKGPLIPRSPFISPVTPPPIYIVAPFFGRCIFPLSFMMENSIRKQQSTIVIAPLLTLAKPKAPRAVKGRATRRNRTTAFYSMLRKPIPALLTLLSN